MGLFDKSMDERENSILKALDTKLEIIQERNERKIEKIEEMEDKVDSIQEKVDELNNESTEEETDDEDHSFDPEIDSEEFIDSSGERRKEVVEMFLPEDIFVTKYHIIEAIFGLKKEDVDSHDPIYYGVSRTLNNLRKEGKISVSEKHFGSNKNGYKLIKQKSVLESEYRKLDGEDQREEILEHVPLSPPISTDRVVENMFGEKKDTSSYPYSSVYRQLNRLQEEGKVVSDKSRIDGKDKRVWKDDT